jgi:predicted DNA-binding ribbon-helix-helix protein
MVFISAHSRCNKRSIVILGRKTSVSLEDEFWQSLKEIGRDRKVTLPDLVGSIATRRLHGNLSSAIRLFVLDYFRNHVSGSSSADYGLASEQMRLMADEVIK